MATTTIYAIVSTTARQAEIARTGCDPGTVIELDLSSATPDERAELAAAMVREDDHRVSGYHIQAGALALKAYLASDTTPAAILAGVRLERAEQTASEAREALATEARAAEREARVAEAEQVRAANSASVRAVLDDLVSRVTAAEEAGSATQLALDTPAGTVRLTLDYRHAERPRLDKATDADVLALAARLEAVRDRAEAARVAAEAQQAAAARAARAAARGAWLRDHASAEQRERAEAGLLPESDVLAGLEAIVWSRMAAEVLYERLTADDASHADPENDSDNEPCQGAVTFSSSAATEADAEEFARLKAIRALAPEGAMVTLRTHEVVCDAAGCPGANTRAGVRVEITTGGRTFRREFSA